MGSSEFLQALLSTIDNSYYKKFSLKTKILLNFCKLFFPKYIKKAAINRLKLKKDIFKAVFKNNPKTIIELGSGHSREYIDLIGKRKLSNIIQIDLENLIDVKKKGYEFIKGDITKEKFWEKIKISSKKGVIISEGLFTYLSDEEFNFVIENISNLLKRGFNLVTHEPIKPISFSRKIISIFIGKTYRRFNSIKMIKEYYSSRGLKIKVISKSDWQVVYLAYY